MFVFVINTIESITKNNLLVMSALANMPHIFIVKNYNIIVNYYNSGYNG